MVRYQTQKSGKGVLTHSALLFFIFLGSCLKKIRLQLRLITKPSAHPQTPPSNGEGISERKRLTDDPTESLESLVQTPRTRPPIMSYLETKLRSLKGLKLRDT